MEVIPPLSYFVNMFDCMNDGIRLDLILCYVACVPIIWDLVLVDWVNPSA